MGATAAKPSGAWQRLFKKQEFRVLIVGLDAAGKTSILYMLKLGEVVTTIPTIGFNVETVEHGDVLVTTWDVGGKDKIRPLWRHYYPGAQALVYVFDSNDRDRADDARDELQRFLCEDELRGVPLLVYANKQDLPNAMTSQEVADRLGLHSIRQRRWYIQASCAHTGYGLSEGYDWLVESVTGRSVRSPPVDPLPGPHDLFLTLCPAWHEDGVDILCRNAGGDDLVTVSVQDARRYTVSQLRSEVADRLAWNSSHLRLVSPVGQLLRGVDDDTAIEKVLCPDVDGLQPDVGSRCRLERCQIS